MIERKIRSLKCEKKNEYRNHKQYTRYNLYYNPLFIVNWTKYLHGKNEREKEPRMNVMHYNKDYE